MNPSSLGSCGIYKNPSVRHQSLRRLTLLRFASILHTVCTLTRLKFEVLTHHHAALPMKFYGTSVWLIYELCATDHIRRCQALYFSTIAEPPPRDIRTSTGVIDIVFIGAGLSSMALRHLKDIFSPSYTTEWLLHGYLSPSLALTRVA